MKRVWVFAFAAILASAAAAFSQAPDVPVQKQGRQQTKQEDDIAKASKDLFSSGKAVKLAEVKEQLKRKTCELNLPAPLTKKLTSREICIAARNSHVRIGWSYLCSQCDDWHVNLAGGYFLTDNGAVATCYHVTQPEREMKDGCLVAVDEAGKIYGVTEILAANRYSDTCIVKIEGSGFNPLSLNTNVYPGDVAYCYSDPLDHRGYFSAGIVNRFYQFPGRRPVAAPEGPSYAPVRLNVGTEWAPGSSGSAVLDECGNVIGHVSTIATVMDDEKGDAPEKHNPRSSAYAAMIVFHEAVGARDVLWLIKGKK